MNIGKTKVTPAEHAPADYATSAGRLAPYADYLVVNVSSPNTPGLRDLQSVEALRPILEATRVAADEATVAAGIAAVPLLVKIAPDLSDDDVDAVAELAAELGLDGIVAVEHDHRPRPRARRAARGRRCWRAGSTWWPACATGSVRTRSSSASAASPPRPTPASTSPSVRRSCRATPDSIYEGPAYASRITRALAADQALRGTPRRTAVA